MLVLPNLDCLCCRSRLLVLPNLDCVCCRISIACAAESLLLLLLNDQLHRQTVWLEQVHQDHIKALEMKTTLEALTLTVHSNSAGAKFTAHIVDGGEQVATATGTTGVAVSISIPSSSIKLWSPDSPFLYVDLCLNCIVSLLLREVLFCPPIRLRRRLL